MSGVRDGALSAEAEPGLPLHALFAWTPRCLAHSLADCFEAGTTLLPYAALAYRQVKPLLWPRSPALSAYLRHCVASLAAAYLSTPRSFSSLFLDLHLKSGAAGDFCGEFGVADAGRFSRCGVPEYASLFQFLVP